MSIIVSIITPCYNAGAYISDTIESVLSQTYTYWEMIIVDDCSNDNSAQIIKKYSEKDERIKYLKTERPSGSPTIPRNIAILNSIGKYVAFLDSDDVWLPNKLEEQVAFAEKNNYQFVYSNYEKMTWEGMRNNRILAMKETSSYSDIIKSCEIPCLTALLKKEIIDGILFRQLHKEDYVFWLEILKKGHIAYNTNQVHAIYRESDKSRSSNKFSMFSFQWYILRNIENIGFFKACYCFLIYAVKGLYKYLQ